MFIRILHIVGLLACLALIAACFMPWAYYQQIGETFTGFYVTRFKNGTYYGKAGYFISTLALLIFIGMIIPRLWAKRLNLFLAALLFAYCIRTYIVFTSSLFESEVERKFGIFLLLASSLFILVSAAFPKLENQNKAGQE